MVKGIVYRPASTVIAEPTKELLAPKVNGFLLDGVYSMELL